MTTLEFKKTEVRPKGFFSGPDLDYYFAHQNNFIYAYILAPHNDWLRGAYMKTPDGFCMFFDMRNENNKFLDSVEVLKVWFQSHADGVSKLLPTP